MFVQYSQIVNELVGYNNGKNHILRKKRRVLEILIPKTIDKKIFLSYNVDIILFYSADEYLVHTMNKYADAKNSDLHKIKEPLSGLLIT